MEDDTPNVRAWFLVSFPVGIGLRQVLVINESKSDFIMELNLLLLKSKSIKLSDIENKIELRNKARTTKDYILSDKIRDELLDVGIDLKDNPDGSTNWSVKI